MSSPKSLKKETTSLSITSTEVDTKTTTLKVESATVASTSLKRSPSNSLNRRGGECKRRESNESSEECEDSCYVSSSLAVAQASTAFKWLPALALPAHQPRQLLPIISGPSTSTTKGDIPQVGPATCLYGIHLEQKATSKVAMFDLDDTLITRKSGKKFSDDSDDWKLWTTNVGEKLRNAVSDGFSIVVITNQAGLPVKGREAKWKQKIPQIAQSAFSDIPFRIFAAKEKDGFRKPMLGMWDALVEEFKKQNVVIDKNASYFVGDAAGRTKPKDHSAVDRKLAHNMGIQFYTPDQFFKERKEKLPPLLGFHPSKLEVKDPMPSLISPSTAPEIFAPVGYIHINQDTLKDKKRCAKEAERVVSEGGRCVIGKLFLYPTFYSTNWSVTDNTNRDKATRAEYIGIAKRLKCPVRCVWFDVAPELAWHNNMYRAFHQRVPDVESSTLLETSAATVIEGGDKELGSDSESEGKPKKGRPKKVTTTTKTKVTTATTTKATTIASSAPRKLVPWIAYTTFRSHFQEPESSEGFDKIDRVGFVFEGARKKGRGGTLTWNYKDLLRFVG
ncbi:PNK3P protein [Rhizoctonia solani]|uniref:PNK3P protein n=1 Tax=Rhizoctonia solani TaxID=456999 RepID=A0A8H7IH10_9AGAM|nr:PNK3P protein [Rhizoctonia solani]